MCPVLQRANIEVANFHVVHLLITALFLLVLGPGFRLISPLIESRMSWKAEQEFG